MMVVAVSLAVMMPLMMVLAFVVVVAGMKGEK